MIDYVMYNAADDKRYILRYLWHFGVIHALAQQMFIVWSLLDLCRTLTVGYGRPNSFICIYNGMLSKHTIVK